MADKIIYFFLILFLITCSFSIFISNFALYSALTAYIVSYFLRHEKFKYNKIYTIMLVFVIINVLALFISGFGISGIGKAKNVMCFMAFIIAYEKGAVLIDKLKMLGILQFMNVLMLVCAIVVSAAGLTNYFLFEDFANWAHQYSGLFSITITYGEFLVMIQCVSLAVVMNKGNLFLSGPKRGLFMGLMSINMVALLLTYARGPWLIMCFMAFLLVLLNRYYKTAIALTICSLLLLGLIISPKVKEWPLLGDLHIRLTSTLSGYSSGREVIYAAGMRMIRDNPILGVGLGGVEKNYASYAKKIEWAEKARQEMVYGHLHNLYLQIYAELGLAGIITFLWLCFYVLYKFYNYFKIKPAECGVNGAYIKGVLAAFISMLLMGFSEYNFFHNEVSRLMWFLIGMAFYEIERAEKLFIDGNK
ncbi:MAG: O-antigen ligase family protein [Candidatus Wallbacteria bacterium]